MLKKAMNIHLAPKKWGFFEKWAGNNVINLQQRLISRFPTVHSFEPQCELCMFFPVEISKFY